MPGKFIVGVAVAAPAVIPGPDQMYVPPPVPITVPVVVKQVNVVEFEAEGVGAVVFCVTVTGEGPAEQP